MRSTSYREPFCARFTGRIALLALYHIDITQLLLQTWPSVLMLLPGSMSWPCALHPIWQLFLYLHRCATSITGEFILSWQITPKARYGSVSRPFMQQRGHHDVPCIAFQPDNVALQLTDSPDGGCHVEHRLKVQPVLDAPALFSKLL